MASYRAIAGSLNAIKQQLESKMSGDLDQYLDAPSVKLLGTHQLKDEPMGNAIGIYLHRISVDPFSRNRYIQASPNQKLPELPVNLHILLIAWTDKALNEGALLSWAMQHIGSAMTLDIAHLGVADPLWREEDSIQLQPEEMSTEDLLRIWEGLPRDYMLSVPYLLKTVRLASEAETINPLVHSQINHMKAL